MNNFPRPGGGPPPAPPIRREEFRTVPCKKCGDEFRRLVSFVRVIEHRLDPGRMGPEPVNLMYCAGCGAQLTPGENE